MARRLLIVLGVLVVIVVAALVTLSFVDEGQSPAGNQTVSTTPATTNTAVNTTLENVNVASALNTNTAGVDDETRTKGELARLAANFAERFGSYSTDSDYENIAVLTPFMSQQMETWASGYVAAERAKLPSEGPYLGVTTKALSTKLTAFEASVGTAAFTISTQRRESTGTTANARVYYQDITIRFVTEDDVFKVDEARWR